MTGGFLRFLRGNMLALLALFIALGGTTYAATALPKNSVGTKQLKKNAVTALKIKNGNVTALKLKKSAVTNAKIAANAVTGAKVKDDSLTGADVLESSLAKVPSAAAADTATSATNATNAGNASTLGGIPAGGFLRATNQGGGALAGANVAANGTVNAYFNRFGGAPTVSHTAASGVYVITFPGLEGKLLNSRVIHLATLFGITGEILTSSSGANPYIGTFNSSGAAADRSFYYAVFGTNLAP
jgi:hypothetical protein